MTTLVSNPYCTPLPWNEDYERLQAAGAQIKRSLRPSTNPIDHRHRVVWHQNVFPSWMPQIFKNLELRALVVFTIPSGWTGVIHTDGAERQTAVNVPLAACEQGIMEWFDPPMPGRPGLSDTGKTTLGWPVEAATSLVYSTTIPQPTIVKIDRPHRLNNKDNPKERWMLSFRFRPSVSYEEVVSALTTA